MNKLLKALLHRSVPSLTRLAAVLALLGLAMMCAAIVIPSPLAVVLAMSVGHAIGAGAVACYALAILLTMRRSPPLTDAPAVSTPAPPPEAPAPP